MKKAALMTLRDKECSDRPYGSQGCDLGPGQMVKEFYTVVLWAPVKAHFDYHLLEVTSRRD